MKRETWNLKLSGLAGFAADGFFQQALQLKSWGQHHGIFIGLRHRMGMLQLPSA